MVILFPMETKFKNYSFILKCLFYIFLGVIISTLSLTLLVKKLNSALPFRLCFPLIDPNNSRSILNNITWFISCSQLSSLLIVCIQHTLLLIVLQHSKQNLKKTNSEPLVKRSLVIQLVIGTGCNALCWLPTSIIYISMLILPNYNINLIVWTVVFLVPVTSHLYPCVLYHYKLE